MSPEGQAGKMGAWWDQSRGAGYLLEIEGANTFRIRAYRNAGHTVRDLPQEIAAMLNKREDLTELPGIGEDLAAKIKEIVETGTCAALEEHRKAVPRTLTELLTIPGIGPQRVKTLFHDLGIRTIGELEMAAQQGREGPRRSRGGAKAPPRGGDARRPKAERGAPGPAQQGWGPDELRSAGRGRSPRPILAVSPRARIGEGPRRSRGGAAPITSTRARARTSPAGSRATGAPPPPSHGRAALRRDERRELRALCPWRHAMTLTVLLAALAARGLASGKFVPPSGPKTKSLDTGLNNAGLRRSLPGVRGGGQWPASMPRGELNLNPESAPLEDYEHNLVSATERADVPGIRRLGRLDARAGGPVARPATDERQTDRLDLRHTAAGQHDFTAARRPIGRQIC